MVAGPTPRFDPDVWQIAQTRTSATAAVVSAPAPHMASAARVLAAPVSLAVDATPAKAPAEFRSFVQNAGGSTALAERLWTQGITREDAVGALTLAMHAPSIEDFASARLLVEILSWSQADSRVSAQRVQSGFRNLKDAVVVRPDGVVAQAIDGKPIEALTLQVREGRLEASGLPVGALFVSRSGVLFETKAGRSGELAGELFLQHDFANSLLDGAELVIVETLKGSAMLLKGLKDDPEATLTGLVHAVGSMPKQAVKLAFESPQALRRFKNLPEQAQLQVAGKLVSSLALAVAGLGATAEAAAASGAVLRQATLRVGLAEMGAGRVVPFFSIQGLPALSNATGAIGRAAAWDISQPALRIRDGDLADPKIRYANEEHIGRTVKDPRIEGATVDDLSKGLDRVKAQPANTQRVYAQMAKEYLQTHMKHASLEDVGKLYRTLDGLDDAAALEVKSWVHDKFRAKIEELGDAATPRARAAAQEIRRHADEAGLNLHEVFRPRLNAPPRSSLSVEAQKALGQIEGAERSVTVSSRAVAEEVLSQFPELAQTQRWPKWKTKSLLNDGFDNTFHWDDVRGPDGRAEGHAPDNPHGDQPHLQFDSDRLQNSRGPGEQHVEFPW